MTEGYWLLACFECLTVASRNRRPFSNSTGAFCIMEIRKQGGVTSQVGGGHLQVAVVGMPKSNEEIHQVGGQRVLQAWVWTAGVQDGVTADTLQLVQKSSKRKSSEKRKKNLPTSTHKRCPCPHTNLTASS
eukprot:TRINITY_DN13777_c0_g1_i1.p1 TRINITY_DN13777_c0_g1~~TRINITY_DN13777_c0_g1_i1.p1  ORF type:complete len:131 (+),score=9.31 TRINITY_DN13777_c0_g1_i1:121-513(+)